MFNLDSFEGEALRISAMLSTTYSYSYVFPTLYASIIWASTEHWWGVQVCGAASYTIESRTGPEIIMI